MLWPCPAQLQLWPRRQLLTAQQQLAAAAAPATAVARRNLHSRRRQEQLPLRLQLPLPLPTTCSFLLALQLAAVLVERRVGRASKALARKQQARSSKSWQQQMVWQQ
jgi:hypothetical protein